MGQAFRFFRVELRSLGLYRIFFILRSFLNIFRCVAQAGQKWKRSRSTSSPDQESIYILHRGSSSSRYVRTCDGWYTSDNYYHEFRYWCYSDTSCGCMYSFPRGHHTQSLVWWNPIGIDIRGLDDLWFSRMVSDRLTISSWVFTVHKKQSRFILIQRSMIDCDFIANDHEPQSKMLPIQK